MPVQKMTDMMKIQAVIFKIIKDATKLSKSKAAKYMPIIFEIT